MRTRRVHFRKKRISRIKKKNLFFILLLVTIISIFSLLFYISKKIEPILLETAEFEVNKFSTIIVNKAISQVLEDKINTDNIFEMSKNKNDEIQTIDFNPVIVNQILSVATTVVQSNLKLLESGELESIGVYDMDLSENRINDLEKGIIMRIPMGVVSNNSLFSNLGPKIPIRLHYLGDVNSNITTNISQYGINNAMIEVGIHIEMTAQIILPLMTKKKVLDYNIPVVIKIVQGIVPSYYGNGLLKDSAIYSLPFSN